MSDNDEWEPNEVEHDSDFDMDDFEPEQPVKIKRKSTRTRTKQKATVDNSSNDNSPLNNSSLKLKRNTQSRKRQADEKNTEPPPSKKIQKISDIDSDPENKSADDSNASVENMSLDDDYNDIETKETTSISEKLLKTKTTKKKIDKKNETKKSKKTASDSTAVEKVKTWLLEQNRPHNVKSIVDNSRGELKIGQTKKAINVLVDDDILIKKTFKNSEIVWASQKHFGEISDEHMKKLTSRVNELQKSLEERHSKLGKLKSTCNNIESELSDEQIESTLSELRKRHQQLSSKLTSLKNTDTKLISKDEMTRLQINFYKLAKAWKQRRSAAYNMIGLVFENKADKPKKILTRDLDCESDGDGDVNFDNYKELFKKCATVFRRNQDSQKKRKK